MAEIDNDKDKAAPAKPPEAIRPTAAGAIQAGKPGLKDTDQVVDQWFQDFFPAARTARGEAWWQEAARAKEVLKERLKG